VIYGGIEGGGTKWICAVGSGPDDLQAIVTIPTTSPGETIDGVAEFFAVHPGIVAIGVGFFDFAHQQTGHANNYIELHPLLSLRRL
jgi:predicted NBD/HSP70 family sugar kinase